MQLEEDELADAFENYQLEISAELPETTHIPTALTMEQTSEPIAHTCHACKAGTLSTVNLENSSIWQCSNCNLRFTEDALQLLQHHSSTCPGTVLYTQNSPGDVIILCTICELCAAL
jgi:ribosomal protein L37AE/L43A